MVPVGASMGDAVAPGSGSLRPGSDRPAFTALGFPLPRRATPLRQPAYEAGITRPDALEDFGRRVATLETVIPVDLGGEVPAEPIDSEALNRADDEVF